MTHCDLGIRLESLSSVEDVLRCLRLFDQSTPRSISSRVVSLEAFAEKLYRHALNYQSVDETGKTIGFLSFYANDPIVAFLTEIAVDEESRQRGVGSLMMRRMLSEVRKRGQQRLRLEVDGQNVAAVTFYRKHGFSIEESAGGSAVFMTKEIAY